MDGRPLKRCASRVFLLEVYSLLNQAGLVADILLAHGANQFRHQAEYIPLVFSIASTVLLSAGMITWWRRGANPLWHWLGGLVGAGSVLVGIAGLVYHLESQFFTEWTIASLVYTAPFAAPLAYTGLGLLILLNRFEDWRSPQWQKWVLVMALGGFGGNFVFSLADHAQNGFFRWEEWISVAAAAFAVGFLFPTVFVRVGTSYYRLLLAVMGIEIGVGVLGFVYHSAGAVFGLGPDVLSNVLYEAPILAPLLFADLALLVALAIFGGTKY